MRVPGSLILSFTIAASLSSSAIASDTAPGDDAPVGFAAFIGTWTLEDDAFSIVWDGQTVETQTIPNHITVCTSETTASSVSCAVDGGGLAGQIFWVADETRRSLHHLSHFGERRRGVGTGRIAPDGSLTNRVVFSDEPQGTYRIYEYRWTGPDRYTMMSRQYAADGTPTGNYYAGTFIRVVE